MSRLAVAGGRGDIIVPALAGDIDIPVAGPWNDEFDGQLGSAWTRIASAATSDYILDVDKTVRSCLYMKSVSVASGSTPGIMRPSPPIPFTVTAKVAAIGFETQTMSFQDLGICLLEATPGKFIHGAFDVGFAGSIATCGSIWTSPTVWSNNIGDTGFTPGSALDVAGYAMMTPHYTRFVVNSPTSVDGYTSRDGKTWIRWLTAYNPGFTIGNIGIDYHAPVGAQVAFDWFRVTTP